MRAAHLVLRSLWCRPQRELRRRAQSYAHRRRPGLRGRPLRQRHLRDGGVTEAQGLRRAGRTDRPRPDAGALTAQMRRAPCGALLSIFVSALALGELEAAARTGATVLLALD